MITDPTVVLAKLTNGQHVQVGKARSHADAYALFERLDHDLSGFHRDSEGRLRMPPSGYSRSHFIDGHAVSFYRLRQQGHEFGTLPSYPIRAIKLTNKEVITMSKSVKRTPAGITRPKRGTFTNWTDARSKARVLNEQHGRGRRALKAQDGSYAVIFRPAVAANKQRRVRDLGAI